LILGKLEKGERDGSIGIKSDGGVPHQFPREISLDAKMCAEIAPAIAAQASIWTDNTTDQDVYIHVSCDGPAE
jgi:hypothetical protein